MQSIMARTLIQGADLFPRCRDHFVRNATRLPCRSEISSPCSVSNHPSGPTGASGGNFRQALIIRTPCIALTYMGHAVPPFYLFLPVDKFRRFRISLTRLFGVLRYTINVRLSKYFVTFETTIWHLWELRFSHELCIVVLYHWHISCFKMLLPPSSYNFSA